MLFTGVSGEDLEIASIPIPHPTGVSRAPWNGYQIVEAVADPFAVTAISYSTDDNILTLTWESEPEGRYSVKYSRDLGKWDDPQDGDLDDGIEADAGPTTTREFDLSDAGLEGESRVYFRVELEN